MSNDCSRMLLQKYCACMHWCMHALDMFVIACVTPLITFSYCTIVRNDPVPN